MTMVNAIVQGKRAYLYADTAWVDPATNVVLGFSTKIFAGTKFPWAVGVTAHGLASDVTAPLALLDQGNVAGLRKAMPTALAEFERLSALRGVERPNMRLIAACWDARQQRPRLFGIWTEDARIEGVGAAGEVVEFESVFGCSEDIRHLWCGKTPNDPRFFDPDDGGVAAMEAFRAHHPVGGEVEQAVITRRGVKLFSLYEWPDRVGKQLSV